MLINIIRVGIILTVTIIFSFLFLEELSKLEALNKENDRIREKTHELAKENEEFKLKIEALKNDERYIEITARQELGMIKEDEKVFKFKK